MSLFRGVSYHSSRLAVDGQSAAQRPVLHSHSHPAVVMMTREGADRLLPAPDDARQAPLTPRSGVKRSTPETSGGGEGDRVC